MTWWLQSFNLTMNSIKSCIIILEKGTSSYVSTYTTDVTDVKKIYFKQYYWIQFHYYVRSWRQHQDPQELNEKSKTSCLPNVWRVHKRKRNDKELWWHKNTLSVTTKTSCNFKRKCVDNYLHQHRASPLTSAGGDRDSWMTSSGKGNIHISHRMLQEKQVDCKWMTGNKKLAGFRRTSLALVLLAFISIEWENGARNYGFYE